MNDSRTEPAVRLYDRPYGRQEILALNTELTVKIITVDPGGQVSLHRHEKRDEWWTILDGPMNVEVGDRAWAAAPGERVWIPRGTAHRVGNAGAEPGRLLEMAFGLFDEDDIERLAGDYTTCR
ncbi:phosphomannose isomerase type II C-terminal cupin domain [Actinoplanes derwentensis]|uniref:Mannose-6-phosphate isomerase, type 2 n=1 Tax=Actinoplanes derwentensis TaxID=113562 RepID=A0A1H2DDE3_9ACTN|nr:phosphomannose isomerase type II C-terminal cupin domain [Actinoplanes derwentensis]GID90132.1 hypothetical protein Ade03nite_90560 [Actinoplanes derwentensis]SDT80750.1 mannose-6-phosphate isomerase, type 2 [Actinoplanes derwentensis]